jgi:5'-nucleotidase / UDP-sugar diphosphatase
MTKQIKQGRDTTIRKAAHEEPAVAGRKKASTLMPRKTLSRREFLAVSPAVGATILLTGALAAAAKEQTMKKTFTILHTNDMHSSLIGMGTSFGADSHKTGSELQLMSGLGYDATTFGNH